jgi:hypothetical protein
VVVVVVVTMYLASSPNFALEEVLDKRRRAATWSGVSRI